MPKSCAFYGKVKKNTYQRMIMNTYIYSLLSILTLIGMLKPGADSTKSARSYNYYSSFNGEGILYDSVQNCSYRIYRDTINYAKPICVPLNDTSSRFEFPDYTFQVLKVLNGVFRTSTRTIDFGNEGAVKNDGTVIFDWKYSIVHLTRDTVVGAYVSERTSQDLGTIIIGYYDIQSETTVFRVWKTPLFSDAIVQEHISLDSPLYFNIMQIYEACTDPDDPSWIIRNELVVTYFKALYYAIRNDRERALELLYISLAELNNPLCPYHGNTLVFDCINQNIEQMKSL